MTPSKGSATPQVWTNGVDWYVANDLADLAAVYEEHVGEAIDAYDDIGTWSTESPDKTMTIWCNEDGTPGEVDGDGCDRVTKTMAEWAAQNGRGFLASTEY